MELISEEEFEDLKNNGSDALHIKGPDLTPMFIKLLVHGMIRDAKNGTRYYLNSKNELSMRIRTTEDGKITYKEFDNYMPEGLVSHILHAGGLGKLPGTYRFVASLSMTRIREELKKIINTIDPFIELSDLLDSYKLLDKERSN